MKINFYTADRQTTFFVHCDSYIKNTFNKEFFKNIGFIKPEDVFPKYKQTLIDNKYFTFLKNLALKKQSFQENDDILNFYKNFEDVNLQFWKDEYEKFNIDIANEVLLQYFGFNIKEDINVILVPKNSYNDLRLHSGVTNIREKDIIFIFVPEYKEEFPYKRINTEVLIHEIVHLYIYRSEWYKKICEIAVEKYSEHGNKIKIEGICNELFARVFIVPNIFGLIRNLFNRNILAEHPLVDPLNVTANNIIKEILERKITKINNEFVNIFISNLEKYFINKKK